MSIDFGSLMNCLSCSWVQLNTYWTGCWNTWKRDKSRINLTTNSHRCHDILSSSASLDNSIHWTAAPGKVKRSVERSEHWHWIVHQFLSAPRMTAKLRHKQPPMKRYWEQCGHYVHSLYLLANKKTRIYPSKHSTIHSSNGTRWKEFFKNRTCRSLQRPK